MSLATLSSSSEQPKKFITRDELLKIGDEVKKLNNSALQALLSKTSAGGTASSVNNNPNRGVEGSAQGATTDESIARLGEYGSYTSGPQAQARNLKSNGGGGSGSGKERSNN